MKEILLQYTAYNIWANQLIADLLIKQEQLILEKDLGGSFPTILKTVEHIWLAESVWIQRLEMAEHVIVPTSNLEGGIHEICLEWLKCSERLFAFTKKIIDERGFEHSFHYTNLKGDQLKSKVWECLHHVCNHSSFHRGQLINYLRQVGITTIPATDFIAFCRKK